ncbi:hypothetical protein GQ54DRAFT_303596 [Martensiomyces pterosporus]|nr:hypothetical protein GQ54DRAFT_303596 [Martensiomyces pterosporus]
MTGGNAFDDWESAFDSANSESKSKSSALSTSPLVNGSSAAPAPATVATNAQTDTRMEGSVVSGHEEWKRANMYTPYEIKMESDRTTYCPPVRILSRPQQRDAGLPKQQRHQNPLQQAWRQSPQSASTARSSSTQGSRQPDGGAQSLSDKERAYEEARRRIFGE